MEISYGPFESVLELPPGYDLSQAKAIYVNGFCELTYRWHANCRPKALKFQ